MTTLRKLVLGILLLGLALAAMAMEKPPPPFVQSSQSHKVWLIYDMADV